jgi:hypothetical protein
MRRTPEGYITYDEDEYRDLLQGASKMAVRSYEPRDDAPHKGKDQKHLPRRARSQGGIIPGRLMAQLVRFAIPVIALALIALSILGTFYGARGLASPLLTHPLQIGRDIARAPSVAILALCGQVALSVAQWGGRQLARDDRRWWLLYFASLWLSLYWNWRAYGPPLVAVGVPILLAGILILAGDVGPELALVRDDSRRTRDED